MRLVSDINNGNFEQLGVTSQVSILSDIEIVFIII